MTNDTEFDPYVEWLGLPSSDVSDRELLGVTRQASRHEIDEAYHDRYALVRKYQVGAHSAMAVELLEELSHAYHRLISRLSVAAADEMLGRESLGRETENDGEHEEDAEESIAEKVIEDRVDTSYATAVADLVDEVVQSKAVDSHSPSRRRSRRSSSSSSSSSSSRSSGRESSRRGHRRVYHIRTADGRREGPLSRRRLKKYAKYGLIQADTVVWREGWESPRTAGDMYPELEEMGLSIISNLATTDYQETTTPQETPTIPKTPETHGSRGLGVLIALAILILIVLGVYVAWSMSQTKARIGELDVEQVRKTIQAGRDRKAADEKARKEREKKERAKALALEKKKQETGKKLIEEFSQNVEALKGRRKKVGSSRLTDEDFRSSASLRFSGWHNVEVSDSDNMIDLNSNFTVETWIRWPLPPGMEQALFDAESTTQNAKVPTGWSIRTLPDANGFKLVFRVATTKGRIETSSIVLQHSNLWRHIAVSRQKGQFFLFIDGIQVGSAPIPLQCVNAKSNLIIGARDKPSEKQRLDAQLRSVRVSVSGRYAVDFKPRWKLENDRAAVLFYDLTKGEGNHVNDLSGQDRHGAVKGAVWQLIQ